MGEDYEWLSGDDEDSFYYWAVTRDILFFAYTSLIGNINHITSKMRSLRMIFFIWFNSEEMKMLYIIGWCAKGFLLGR